MRSIRILSRQREAGFIRIEGILLHPRRPRGYAGLGSWRRNHEGVRERGRGRVRRAERAACGRGFGAGVVNAL
jgi:hypothetical protein